MIAASHRTFEKYGLGDRVTLIEGPAHQSIQRLIGTFDIVFVGADKDGYERYVKMILDKKLLAPRDLVMCDNGKCWSQITLSDRMAELIWYLVFAHGMTISEHANPFLADEVRPYWTENGKASRRFNIFCKEDPRIDNILLPVYNGVTLIKWKQGYRG